MLPDEATRATVGRRPARRTSKANPTKLAEYSTAGLDMLTLLRNKVTALHAAMEALRPHASSDYVPSLRNVDGQLDELITRWEHLDTFVGDVGEGFVAAADTPEEMWALNHGGVLTVTDSELARRGRIGYADREEAIAAAEDAARELERLIDEDEVPPAEIQAFIDTLAQGQYDPAFAVTFSEAIGVSGYADMTSLIGASYVQDGHMVVPAEGLAAVQVLATTLTTALDTRPGIRTEDRRDPDNARLPRGARLEHDFVQDLTTGWQPEDSSYDWTTEHDLSVLLGMTDPPTDIAVQIANERMSPWLDPNGSDPEQQDWSFDSAHWGDHAGVVTNYATMLGRNPDASIQWLRDSPLDAGSNMELVLQREDRFDRDNGVALANVVENGLTHTDRPGWRRELMEQAIDTIGGEQDEIRNSYLPEALANGVAANMDVIQERARALADSLGDEGVFTDPTGERSDGSGERPGDLLRNTGDFLREVMGHDEAAATVYSATLDYSYDRLATDISAGQSGAVAEDLGALYGLVTESDANAMVGNANELVARQQAFVDGVNQVTDAVSKVLPGGPVVRAGANWGVDQLMDGFVDADAIPDAEEAAADLRLASDDALRRLFTVHAYNAGQVPPGPMMEPFLGGQPGDAHRPIIPIEDMDRAQRDAFYQWIAAPETRNVVAGTLDTVDRTSQRVGDHLRDRTG